MKPLKCKKCGNRFVGSCNVCKLSEDISSKLISGIVGGFASLLNTAPKTCNVCNITWDEILDTGKLGCSNDYAVFKEELGPILLKFHGTKKHKS